MTERNHNFSQQVTDMLRGAVLNAADVTPVEPERRALVDEFNGLREHAAQLAGVPEEEVVFTLHANAVYVLLKDGAQLASFTLRAAWDDPVQQIAKALFHVAVTQTETARRGRDAAQRELAVAQESLDRAEARVRDLRAMTGYANEPAEAPRDPLPPAPSSAPA